MSDRDDALMKQLADVARAEREPVDHPDAKALLAPVTAGELAAITARAGEALGAARVTDLRVRSKWTWVGVAAPLAAAAAIALFMTHPWSARTGMPDYELVVEGDARVVRSDAPMQPQEPIRIERGGALTFILRPRAPRTADVSVRAWIDHGGALDAWTVTSTVSAERAVRVDADAATLAKLPVGPSRIVFFVGEPAAIPSDANVRAAIARPPSGTQALVRDVVVMP